MLDRRKTNNAFEKMFLFFLKMNSQTYCYDTFDINTIFLLKKILILQYE